MITRGFKRQKARGASDSSHEFVVRKTEILSTIGHRPSAIGPLSFTEEAVSRALFLLLFLVVWAGGEQPAFDRFYFK